MKRIVALVLTVVMVFGLLPPMALAEETVSYEAVHAGSVNVDGSLNESQWVLFYEFASADAAPTGRVAALWNKDGLYLGLRSENATALTVKLNGAAKKTVTLNGGVTEVKLTWDELGIALLDYDQQITGFSLELSGDGGTASLAGTLVLTGKKTDVADVGTYYNPHSDAAKGFRLLGHGTGISFGDAMTFNVSQSGHTLAVRSSLNFVKHDQQIVFSQDLNFTNLPVGDASYTAKDTDTWPTVKCGYTFAFSPANDARAMAFAIYKNSEGKLMLRKFVSGGDVDLQRSEGQTFRLSIVWDTDDTFVYYVDGEKVGESQDREYFDKGWGTGALIFTYNTPNENDNAQFTVSNISVLSNQAEPYLPSLKTTTAEILGGNLNLTDDLPQSYTFNDEIGAVPLTWSSEPAGAVTADGKLVRAAQAQTITLTALVGAKALTPCTATIPAAGKMEAYYAAAVTADNQFVESQWLIFQDFASAGTAPTGRAAALWNQNGLYIGVRAENAETLTVKQGSEVKKTVTLSGGVAEVALTWDELGIELLDYDQEISGLTLELIGSGGTASLQRTLVLTGKKTQVADVGTHANPNGDANKGFRLLGHGKGITFGDAMSFDVSEPGYTLAVRGSLDYVDHSQEIVFSQDLEFASLPVGDGTYTASETGTWPTIKCGYTFAFSPSAANNIAAMAFGIYKNSEGKLLLRQFKSGTDIDLQRGLNQKFRLSVVWHADNSFTYYVDGEKIGEAGNESIDRGWATQALIFAYNTPNEDETAQFTVSNISVLSTEKNAYLPTATTAEILGNVLTLVENLPQSYTFSQDIGAVPVKWSSFPAGAVTEDGKLKKTVEDQNVTLTATVGTTALASCDVTIAAAGTMPNVEAAATLDMNVDGKLDDYGWTYFYPLTALAEGDPSGLMSVVYNENGVFVGVSHANADTLTVQLNGKSWILNLDDGLLIGDGTAAVSGNTAELNISWEQLGAQPTDYGFEIDGFALTLSDNGVDTALYEVPTGLTLTAKEVSRENLNTYNTSGDIVTTANTAIFSSAAKKVSYMYTPNSPLVDHTKELLLTQDIRVENMPVVTEDEINNAKTVYESQSVDGYNFWMCDADNATGIGPAAVASIYRINEEGDLILRLLYADEIIPLGRKVGEKFRLSILWKPDGSVNIYVDGALIGSCAQATSANASGMGYQTVYLRYCNYTGGEAKINISDVTLTVAQVDSVLGEITPETTLVGVDPTCVQANLKLPAAYVNKYLGAIPLTWKSSNTDVLTDDGKILDFKPVTLTCSVDNQDIFSVEVNIQPLPEELPGPAAPSPDVLTTAFSASDITLDGVIDEEGWIMNGNVLDNGLLKHGEFGSQWNLNNLFLAVETRAAETLTLTLNGKTAVINLSVLTASGDFEPTMARAEGDTIVELSVPMQNLDLKVEDYGVLVPVTVDLGGAAYTGTLKLTSVDWFATENKEHPLPAPLKGHDKYGNGEPTENQWHEQINDGWRIYDRYDPSGNNPWQVRSYVLMTKNSAFDGWSVHNKTFYAEFDFVADCMPVYDTSAIGWDTQYANYGFQWWMSDKGDSQQWANSISSGILNTEGGLVYVLLGKGGQSEIVSLNKKVGDHFRIGCAWEVGGRLTLYVDGQVLATFENAEENRRYFGDYGIGFSIIRSMDAAQSEADNIEVRVTNVALGTSYDNQLLDSLTFADIRGGNLTQEAITENLVLPGTISTPQLPTPQILTWSSSDETLIDTLGNVYRPASGAKKVTLTASLSNGKSKTFELTVTGLSNHSGNVLVAPNDLNPAVGAGAPVTSYPFTFDTDNNSLIVDLGEKQNVSVAVLKDGDAFARLNEENLTLWISDDNVTYTEIKDFRLLHKGEYWYLYDFEAEARYVKVHCTHFDGQEADFIGEAATMLDAYYEAVFGANGGSFTESTYTVTNNTDEPWKDKAVTVSKNDLGVVGSGIRIYMDGSLLYHYVDGENVTFRVDNLAAGETAGLTILSGNDNAMDISNKEYVYEVVYGTREAADTNARWMLTLPDGVVLAVKAARSGSFTSFSYDGGRTWTELTEVQAMKEKGVIDGGGFIYNPEEPDRIIFQACEPVNETSDLSEALCLTHFFLSEDGGHTWEWIFTLPDRPEDPYDHYILSYSNATLLACHDGDGDNIDYVLPLGAMVNNDGGLSGRVAYSTDNGMTWTLSESLINLGDNQNHEGGCSEMTIEQRSDGVLVLLSRHENDESFNFAQAYSYDNGVTWEDIKVSSVYAPNTQPMFYRYDGAPLLVWGGNNALGGDSKIRTPMNVAVSYDGMETFENIQDLFVKYSYQNLTKSGMNRITNPSVTKGGEDNLLVTWANLKNNEWYTSTIRVYDFTDWFYRTKGAYDSFEHGEIRYEGWEATAGTVTLTDDYASDGDWSMELTNLDAIARSTPYFQRGRVELDVYVADFASFTLELQSAYAAAYGKCAPVGVRVVNNAIAGTGLTLKANDWNTLTFELDLPNGIAKLTVGGETETLDIASEIGDYVCFLALTASSTVYVDNVLVEDLDNAELYTESAADKVMKKISAIGTVTLDSEERIKAARAAYDALTEEQKAKVTNLSVLEAAEARLASLKEASIYNLEASVSLNDEVCYNFYFEVSEELSGVAVADMGLLMWESEPADPTCGNDAKVYPGAVACTGDDAGKYKVSTDGVAAKNMGDARYFRIYVKKTDGTYAYSKLFRYSAKTYAMNKIKENKDADLTKLCIALLNYGAEAQKYFKSEGTYDYTELMNAELTGEQKQIGYQDGMVAELIQADESKIGIFKATEGGFEKKEASVSLGGALSINYYLTATNAATDMKLYVWDSETYGNAETLTAENAIAEINMSNVSGNEFKGTVTGIVARQFDKTVYVCGEYEANGTVYRTGVIAYSFGKYCVNKAGQEVAERDVAMAAAVYGHYASQYLN